jgi:hypothetical protein
MGADKNSSPKRELGLCPKFTTKDSHTSLPRSRSHNEPTNPRNKLKTNPKRKHDSRSKGLSNPVQCQADGPRAWGGWSATLERRVRKMQQNQQRRTSKNGQSVPGPQMVREQLVLRRRSAMPRRTVQPARGRSGTPIWTVRQTTCSKTLTPRKMYARAHKNWTNTRRTYTSRTLCGLQADSSPGLEQYSPR